MIAIGTATTDTQKIIFQKKRYTKAYLGDDLIWNTTVGGIVECAYLVSSGHETIISSSGITVVDEMSVDGGDWEEPRSYMSEWGAEEQHSVKFLLKPGTSKLPDMAFANLQSLRTVIIPDTITEIGERCFDPSTNSRLLSVYIPESVTVIGDKAFATNTVLTGITIPSDVTSIGASAFTYCTRITTINIPSGVTTIEKETFGACRSLTGITIPINVTGIDNRAFVGCTGLTSVFCNSFTPPTLGTQVFYNCPNLDKIYVPSESVAAYKSAWQEYESYIYPDPN